jgi:hypothetical protein
MLVSVADSAQAKEKPLAGAETKPVRCAAGNPQEGNLSRSIAGPENRSQGAWARLSALTNKQKADDHGII